MRYFILLLFIISSCAENNENSITKKEEDLKQKKTTKTRTKHKNVYEVELINGFIEGRIDSDSLLQRLLHRNLMDGNKYEHSVTISNFDDDDEREIILEFKPLNDNATSTLIFILDKQKINYFLIGFLDLEPGFSFEPKIDTINKIIFYQSRVYGTCDDGFCWVGSKIINKKLIEVIRLAGEHGGNSCGTYDEEDTNLIDIELESRVNCNYEFISKDTLINYCTVSQWTHDFNNPKSKKNYKIKSKKIKLFYVFNPSQQEYECHNEHGYPLYKDNSMTISFEFIGLIENGKL